MPELTSRIDYALTAPEPDVAVERIKQAIVDELRRLDPALEEIAILADFNHSYRPDFMLRWGSGQRKRERPVYLRLVAGGFGGRLDLETLAERRPLFLGLLHHRLEGADLADIGAADESSADVAGAALVSDATALDQLDVGVDDLGVPTVATSALVRAGSGFLGAEAAKHLRDAVATGYAAAVAGGAPDEVDQAAKALEPYLSAADTQTVDLQLDLLWLAGGGDIDELEDKDRLLHADLRPDEWTLVLDQFLTREDESSDQLWRLFGSRVRLDDAAAAVSKIDEAKHLDAFVDANARHWKARYAGVATHTGHRAHGWWVIDSTLAWGFGEVSLAFTASKRKFNRLGAPLERRSFDELRAAVGRDRLLSLDARADATSIRLSAEQALPSDRVTQIADWTSEVEGLKVETTIDSEPVELDISYETGTFLTNRELPLREMQRQSARYFGARHAPGDGGFVLRVAQPPWAVERSAVDSHAYYLQVPEAPDVLPAGPADFRAQFELVEDRDRVRWRLTQRSGQVIAASSGAFANRSLADQATELFRANALAMIYETYEDPSGGYRWRAKSENGEIVAVSGEAYASFANASRAANLAPEIASNAAGSGD